MVQKKKKKEKLKQNSIAELLGTSINWFLATSSQPYQGFSCWWLKTDSIRVGCCFWITVELIVSKKGYRFIRQSMKLPVKLATKDKLACKLGQTFSSNMESKTKETYQLMFYLQTTWIFFLYKYIFFK